MASSFIGRRLTLRSAVLFSGVSAACTLRHQHPIRMDALSSLPDYDVRVTPQQRMKRRSPRYMDDQAEMMAQISGGCMTGLLTGIAVSMMSKVIIFVAGAAASAVVLAYRLGLNPLSFLKVPERFKPRNVIPSITQRVPFKAAFSITFMIAAFGRI